MNITVPIAVEGMDAQGRPFKDDAQALVINRFGGRIRLGRRLDRGQKLLVVGPRDPSPKIFEVVETVVRPFDEPSEYGVVCRDRAEEFWGIRVWGETETPADAKGLLECQMCRIVGFVPLSLSQVDTLRTLGLVGLPCLECQVTTPWAYAEMKMPVKSEEATAQRAVGFHIENYKPRDHRRIYIQLPVQVSSQAAEEEITRTENVSQTGLSFLSSRHYEPNELASIRCPYDPSEEIPAIRTRIIYRRPVEGSGGAIYGVRFEPRR